MSLHLFDHTSYLHRIHFLACSEKTPFSFLTFSYVSKDRKYSWNWYVLLIIGGECAPSRELFASSPKTSCVRKHEWLKLWALSSRKRSRARKILYMYVSKLPVFNNNIVHALLHHLSPNRRIPPITCVGFSTSCPTYHTSGQLVYGQALHRVHRWVVVYRSCYPVTVNGLKL